MAHKYLVDFLLGVACLFVVGMTAPFVVNAEAAGGYASGTESFTVMLLGAGLVGIAYVLRRLRGKEKE